MKTRAYGFRGRDPSARGRAAHTPHPQIHSRGGPRTPTAAHTSRQAGSGLSLIACITHDNGGLRGAASTPTTATMQNAFTIRWLELAWNWIALFRSGHLEAAPSASPSPRRPGPTPSTLPTRRHPAHTRKRGTGTPFLRGRRPPGRSGAPFTALMVHFTALTAHWRHPSRPRPPPPQRSPCWCSWPSCQGCSCARARAARCTAWRRAQSAAGS